LIVFLCIGGFALVSSLTLLSAEDWTVVWGEDLGHVMQSPETAAHASSPAKPALPLLIAGSAQAVAARLSIFLLLTFVVAGVISRILASAEFRRRFGMSRGELAAEARETEVRPEIKAAQRELAEPE
jgi:hypothetical protein